MIIEILPPTPPKKNKQTKKTLFDGIFDVDFCVDYPVGCWHQRPTKHGMYYISLYFITIYVYNQHFNIQHSDWWISCCSQVTSTTTITVTKTTTFYISTYAVCASVTTEVSSSVTACRRRRQYWIDVPVYIALDEDVDEQLNQFFSIHPSNTYQYIIYSHSGYYYYYIII